MQIDKSIDGVLGTRTRGGRMEGADESTELLQHPQCRYRLCEKPKMKRKVAAENIFHGTE